MNSPKLCHICREPLGAGWVEAGKHKECSDLSEAVDALTALSPADMAGERGAELLQAALDVPDLRADLVIHYDPGMEPSTNRRLMDLDNQVLQLEAELRDIDAEEARLLKELRSQKRQREEARKYLRNVESERARLVAKLETAEVAS